MKDLLAVTLVLVACIAGCGPSWKVVKRPRGDSSTLATTKTFSVKPLDFSAVSIDGKPEATWRAAAGEAKSQWWDKDKEIASKGFMQMITKSTKGGRTFTEAGADAKADAPVVVLQVRDIHDPDFQLTLQITTPAGDVIEEATMTLTIPGYGVSEELRGSAKRMADAVTEYLATQ